MISAPFLGRCSAWAVAIALLAPAAADAQVSRAMFLGGGAPQQNVNNANYMHTGSEWMNAHGESIIHPARYCGEPGMMPGGGCASGCGPGGYGACNCGPGGCGGYGSGPCMGGGGPYPPGGPYGATGLDPALDAYGNLNLGVDQCGPHYFDFSAEVLAWRRERTADPELPFTSDGIVALPLDIDDAALSTKDLDFGTEPGIRLTGRYDLGALSLLEVSYSGLFEWADRAQVTSGTNSLFSPFSEFGNNPFGGAGLTETDAASLHSIEYWSELHNAEISIRRYWVGFNPRVTGTLMAGFRYTNLQEDFFWHTEATGTMDYRVATFNHLAGFQGGGDVWVTVRQGCRIGAHGKAGIYNNQMKQRTDVDATTVNYFAVKRGDRAAFIAEGGVGLVCDVHPNISIKGGYDVLFINTVALAPNNVNFNNALFLGGDLDPVLIEESSVFYHGANLGLEYVW